jgi:hypothetical protein
MDIKIANIEGVNLLNNSSTNTSKKNSVVRIFTENENSFTLVFDSSKIEEIKKIQAALELALDYLGE